MKLHTWEPDIRTLLERVRSGEINLQPDFQRGEVWGTAKKRRLIDTIFRGWHIPPVHVVVDSETERFEVLDGQQRLAAIRDFANGDLTIDGTFSPEDREIQNLHGKAFSELSEAMQRRFNNYTLQIIRITDYEPEEPGELFFRLNQPTNLTAAEQRNAFYGQARSQVKRIVDSFSTYGIPPDRLGFRNSRMAYDDIVAKICYAHHVGTLREKITANVITGMYRSGEPFHSDAVDRVKGALRLFGAAIDHTTARKFNKATVFSWLAFVSLLRHTSTVEPSIVDVGEFLQAFESLRDRSLVQRWLLHGNDAELFEAIPVESRQAMLGLFDDRATSRVADVSSVLSRDLVLWVFYCASPRKSNRIVDRLGSNRQEVLADLVTAAQQPGGNIISLIEGAAMDSRWGSLR